jgi:hypothetical protein
MNDWGYLDDLYEALMRSPIDIVDRELADIFIGQYDRLSDLEIEILDDSELIGIAIILKKHFWPAAAYKAKSQIKWTIWNQNLLNYQILQMQRK